MGRNFCNEDGQYSPIPWSRADARRLRQPTYNSGAPCTYCKSTTRYTTNTECPHCETLVAIDFFNFAVGAAEFVDIDGPTLWFSRLNKVTGEQEDRFANYNQEGLDMFERMKALISPNHATTSGVRAKENGETLWVRTLPCSRAGHLGIRTLTGECYFCKKDRETPSARQAAKQAGEAWYIPAEDCKLCGTRSRRRVVNGHCEGCHPAPTPSPRQAAVAAGDAWYTPVESCGRCGTLSRRRVSNGACEGCLPGATTDNRRTPDSIMMETCPDLVIGKKEAKTLGMKVYRTGVACSHDHRGYRYVSTGSCIECLRSN